MLFTLYRIHVVFVYGIRPRNRQFFFNLFHHLSLDTEGIRNFSSTTSELNAVSLNESHRTALVHQRFSSSSQVV